MKELKDYTVEELKELFDSKPILFRGRLMVGPKPLKLIIQVRVLTSEFYLRNHG